MRGNEGSGSAKHRRLFGKGKRGFHSNLELNRQGMPSCITYKGGWVDWLQYIQNLESRKRSQEEVVSNYFLLICYWVLLQAFCIYGDGKDYSA